MVVKVFCLGGIPEGLCHQIREFVSDTLVTLKEPDHYVEVHVLPTKSAMRAALQAKLDEWRRGQAVAVPDFVTFHEAFAGYPRIWASAEMDLGEPRSRAALQHEVGHAVLHWEMSSYLIGTARSLVAAADQGRMSLTEAAMISYIALLGVKDYEVSSLLERCGIVDDQIEFYCEQLEEVGPKSRETVELVGEMKVVLGSAPFCSEGRPAATLERTLNRLGEFGAVCRDIIFDLSHDPGGVLVEKLEATCQRILSHHG